MSTANQDSAFGGVFLESIIEWIAENVDPEDVFEDRQLRDWAENNNFVSAGDVDVHHCQEIDLETWAEDNGYVKED